MSEITNEPTETTEAPEAVETPTADDFRISRDDWGTLVGAVREMYGRQSAPPQQYPQEQEEYEEEDADLGEMIARYVQDQISPLRQTAARQMEREGREQLESLFSEAEKHPEIGKFDHKLAEKASHAFFIETGVDPNSPEAGQAARWAAIEGAKYAAQMQKQFGAAAVEEYKKSIAKQPFSDGPAGVGGVRSESPDKTMDDVADRWQRTYGQGAEEV